MGSTKNMIQVGAYSNQPEIWVILYLEGGTRPYTRTLDTSTGKFLDKEPEPCGHSWRVILRGAYRHGADVLADKDTMEWLENLESLREVRV